MPDQQSEGSDAIAKAIEAYLRVRPHAADTLEGIARWWLSGELQNAPVEELQRAVEKLCQQGLLHATQRSGQILYCAAGKVGENGTSRRKK